MESMMRDCFDVGKTTHNRVTYETGGNLKKMYDFVMENAHRYVDRQIGEGAEDPYGIGDSAKIAAKVVTGAQSRLDDANPDKPFYVWASRILVAAYNDGEFPIEPEKVIFPDTVPMFKKVKEAGRLVCVMTSFSQPFTEILFGMPLTGNQILTDLVDEYYTADNMGDKNLPETFADLWTVTEGGIHAIFDDKPLVCRSAWEGLRSEGGSANIYLVDRRRNCPGDELGKLEKMGIRRITTFDEVVD